jgi:hypothetical protein
MRRGELVSETVGWPNWKRGQTLRAGQLRELESFLLAGGSLLGDGSHGVVWLDLEKGFKIEAYEGALLLTILGLSGITPGGRPVAIGDPADYRDGEGWLEDPQMAVQVLFPVPDMTADLHFDLFVDVGTDPQSEKKLVGRCAIVGPKDAPPGTQPESLYVGRYRWSPHRARQIDVVLRPLVRTFRALRPWDAGWERWTGELHFRLREILQDVQKESLGHSEPAWLACTVDAHRLYLDWTSMTYIELCRAWQRMNRLRAQVTAGLESVRPTPDRPWLPASASGEMQPSQIVGYCLLAKSASVYAQWRLADGVVLEGMLKDDYLRFWIVGGVPLPRGRLHLVFEVPPPPRVEIGQADSKFLAAINGVPGIGNEFNIQTLAIHLEHGEQVVIRGLGRVNERQIAFRMG